MEGFVKYYDLCMGLWYAMLLLVTEVLSMRGAYDALLVIFVGV